jgi:hypothetical protein
MPEEHHKAVIQQLPPEPEQRAVEAWNDPAYIQAIADEGFPGSGVHTDEAFRFHLNRFVSAGGAARSSKKGEPKEEHQNKTDHKKDDHTRKGH